MELQGFAGAAASLRAVGKSGEGNPTSSLAYSSIATRLGGQCKVALSTMRTRPKHHSDKRSRPQSVQSRQTSEFLHWQPFDLRPAGRRVSMLLDIFTQGAVHTRLIAMTVRRMALEPRDHISVYP